MMIMAAGPMRTIAVEAKDAEDVSFCESESDAAESDSFTCVKH